MNQSEFEAVCLDMKGRLRESWGRLTDNQRAVIDGEFEQFVARLKKKLAAEQELQDYHFTTE